MWAWRVVLLCLLAFVVVYTLNSELESWCHDEYSRYMSKWRKFWHNLSDHSYEIPVSQRQPTLSMKDFYAVPDRGLMDLMMRTRLTFKNQHFLGTVFRDGFHIDLPEDTMWRGGVLVSGPEVQKLRAQALQPPAPVPSAA